MFETDMAANCVFGDSNASRIFSFSQMKRSCGVSPWHAPQIHQQMRSRLIDRSTIFIHFTLANYAPEACLNT